MPEKVAKSIGFESVVIQVTISDIVGRKIVNRRHATVAVAEFTAEAFAEAFEKLCSQNADLAELVAAEKADAAQ